MIKSITKENSLLDRRPQSSQYVSLHVYLMPRELWSKQLQSVPFEASNQTVSLGFLRILPTLSILQLRKEISDQLAGEELLPKDFFFLKCVGRCFTKLKSRQEKDLKTKIFLPPQARCEEVFIMENTTPLTTPSSATTSMSSTSSGFSPSQHNHTPVINYNGSFTASDHNGTAAFDDERRESPNTISSFEKFKKDTQEKIERIRRNMTIDEDNYVEELAFTNATDKRFHDDDTLNEMGNTTIDRGFEINDELEDFRVGFGSYRSDDGPLKKSFLRNSVAYSPPLSASPPPHESEEERRRRLEEEEKRRLQKELEEEMERQRLFMERQRRWKLMLNKQKKDEDSDRRKQLIAMIERLREEREEMEKMKEKLVAKQLSINEKLKNKGNTDTSKEIWRKWYLNEKKATAPIEDEVQKMRRNFDGLNEKIMEFVLKQNPRTDRNVKSSRNKKDDLQIIEEEKSLVNYVKARKNEIELEQMRERLEDVAMKLSTEMKLRCQAEEEIQFIKKETDARKVKLYQNKKNRDGP